MDFFVNNFNTQSFAFSGGFACYFLSVCSIVFFPDILEFRSDISADFLVDNFTCPLCIGRVFFF